MKIIAPLRFSFTTTRKALGRPLGRPLGKKKKNLSLFQFVSLSVRVFYSVMLCFISLVTRTHIASSCPSFVLLTNRRLVQHTLKTKVACKTIQDHNTNVKNTPTRKHRSDKEATVFVNLQHILVVLN